MAFLRTLWWIVVTVIVVVFSMRNWVPVTIALFGNVRADVKLPVLLIVAFLLGFVPLYVWHRISRWRDARRVAPPIIVASAAAVDPLAAGTGLAQAD